MFCYLLACLVDGVGERLENVASLGVVAALHKHEYVVEEEEIALLGLLATLFDEYAFANECAARYGKRFLVVAAKAALDEADAFRVYFRLGYCNINKILLN